MFGNWWQSEGMKGENWAGTQEGRETSQWGSPDAAQKAGCRCESNRESPFLCRPIEGA